ncbi:hypothetical protein [Bacteroides caecimuris]|uniref:hypothetical protein n=1 Tax=Bacteroides caecimuris TaxID=1796613 RepID=UPI00265B1712|nr:hypothetical protein [Bacteroides caecimuris]
MEEVANIYGQVQEQKSVTAEIAMTRQMQEVQGQIIMAKRFPRNEAEAYANIMQACQRKSLAERAEYEYTRGTSKVTGPSIRLAEVIAQNWGNIDFGYVELERSNTETKVLAQAWDLQTNTRQSKVFTVSHIRETKKGNYAITSSRDIYELIANQASRRIRSCILSIIPSDVVESAIQQCRKTLLDGEKKPLKDVVKDVVLAFQRDYNVPVESLEKYIGCKSGSFSMNDCIRLRKVYNSIKDGMAKREEIFELPGVEKKETEDAFAGKEKKEEKLANGQQELNFEGGADAGTK